MDPTMDFPYLGRTVAYNNSNWAALYRILYNARLRWLIVPKVLTKAGAMVQAREMI